MADRYWVGGTGNWDGSTTTHWSSSSGGAGGSSVPTSSDNVIFDTNSNAADAAYTVTITATANCLDFTMDGPGAGNNVTWAGSSALNIFGSMNLIGGSADITRTYTGTITFNASSTGKTVTMNGVSLGGNVTFSNTSGGWTLQDAFDIGSNTLTMSGGNFNTNGQTVTCGPFSGGGVSTKIFTFGSSSISCSTWTIGGSLTTLNADTSTITYSSTFTSLTQAFTYYNVVNTNNNGGTFSVISGTVFNNYTNNTTSTTHSLQPNNSFTVNGTFTLTGSDATHRAFINNATTGTTITITAAAVSISNADFRDITGAGAATWSGTSIGDMDGNSGITFTAAVTRYWVGNGGNWDDTAHWSASSGGASGASVPLCHDDVKIDANSISSGSQTITTNGYLRIGKNINFTGVANTPNFTISAGNTRILGSMTFVAGMTYTGTQVIFFDGRRSSTFTSGGLSLGGIQVNSDNVSGTLIFGDNFNGSSASVLRHRSGAIDFNGKTFTVGIVATSGSVARTWVMGAASVTLGNTGTVWDLSSAGTTSFDAGTSTIIIDQNSTNAKTFAGGGWTYNNFQWTTRSSGTCTVSGNNTFAQFYVTGSGTGACLITGNNTFTVFKADTPPHTFTITAGTTQTFDTPTNSWQVTGTAGNLFTFQSSLNGSAYTFTKVYGIVSADYLSLKDSAATGASSWYAGTHSTNVSGNSGWIFTAGPDYIIIITNETVTISESVQETDDIDLLINDTVTVSETITVESSIGLLIFDTVMLAESAAVDLQVEVSVSDAITVTELMSVDLQVEVSVSDAITVTESVDIFVFFIIDVNDSVSISESVQVNLETNISVFEAIAITESVGLLVWDPIRGLSHMRSLAQKNPLGFDNVPAMPMRSTQQKYPVPMDNNEVF